MTFLFRSYSRSHVRLPTSSHYGVPRNLLQSGRGVNMGDGWETGRHPGISMGDDCIRGGAGDVSGKRGGT